MLSCLINHYFLSPTNFRLFLFLVPINLKFGGLFEIFLIFWGKPVLLSASILEQLLLYPIDFKMLHFHFQFSQHVIYFPFDSFINPLVLVPSCLVFITYVFSSFLLVDFYFYTIAARKAAWYAFIIYLFQWYFYIHIFSYYWLISAFSFWLREISLTCLVGLDWWWWTPLLLFSC